MVAFLASVPAIIAMDRIRIRRQITRSGGATIGIRWRPFKASDLGENMLREYDVIYRDAEGKVHHCMSKIGLLSAVHLIDDAVIGVRGSQQ